MAQRGRGGWGPKPRNQSNQASLFPSTQPVPPDDFPSLQANNVAPTNPQPALTTVPVSQPKQNKRGYTYQPQAQSMSLRHVQYTPPPKDLVQHAANLTKQLKQNPVSFIYSKTNSGFCSFVPLNRFDLLRDVEPVCASLKAAFARDPRGVLVELQKHNAYGSYINPATYSSCKWIDKTKNLHISLLEIGESGEAIQLGIKESKYVDLSFSEVNQTDFEGVAWAKETHEGHLNTESPLLCYPTSPTRVWITLNFFPPQSVPVIPKDQYYFHMSIALLEKEPEAVIYK